MSAIPEDLVVYFTTDRFTDETVPGKLLKNHTLKANVYARLVVLKGEVEFWVEGEPPTMERVLPGDEKVRVLPEQTHWIAPQPGTEFYLELMRSTA